MEAKVEIGPIQELAIKFFTHVAETNKVAVDNVWFEPKMDMYYCRTKNGDFWQISPGDLRNEAKALGW